MYYQKFGDKNKKLLLLHSGGMSGVEWQPQIETLSAHYQLLVPDLLGHGNSILEEEPLTIEKMGKAVVQLLRDEDAEKINVCGSSMGAAVVIWLLFNYPEKIDKAVIYRMTYQKNSGTYEQTLRMADPEYWRKFGLQRWLSKLHEKQGGPDAWETVIRRVSEALKPGQEGGLDYQLQDFERITNEVLLIAGDRDPVAPLEDMVNLYHTIPNAGLWIMPYASHITASNTWRSQAFANEIMRFIGR